MKKILQIANGLALGSTIFINYLSNTGLMNNTTIGEISDDYRSLFTPSGYTFAIWGIIYLLLFGFAIYQGRSLFVKVKNDDFIFKIGWWFVASCVFNCLWIFAWIYEYTGWSCLFIFLLLASLLKIVTNNRMELDDEPFPIIAFVWWPFVVYAGWVTVASIANVSTYLIKIGWNGFGLSEVTWTIILITIAIVINQYILWKRNMREFAVVGAWALIGIGNANKGTNASILYFAFAGAAILLICCAIHTYQNRATNPFIKLKEAMNSSKA
ncbi:tryptophan-rich sensory protein [Winogradskyella sp. UBA3174]|uniref:tryptophan-rich sensory protein n=1 Tax=Winogradskyella sp. UBA3174 TaxID=1947785 RepID=UPI0025F70C72|nr:tryptophan-rich sensory protein [Winogradskyella sp. UBA3174]|tara:strand:+ start:16366 stop:17172 length:807 start_codon:yes stop_codon:yes gene_type:complete